MATHQCNLHNFKSRVALSIAALLCVPSLFGSMWILHNWMYMATSITLDDKWIIAQQAIGINVRLLAKIFLSSISTFFIFFHIFCSSRSLSRSNPEVQNSAPIPKLLVAWAKLLQVFLRIMIQLPIYMLYEKELIHATLAMAHTTSDVSILEWALSYIRTEDWSDQDCLPMNCYYYMYQDISSNVHPCNSHTLSTHIQPFFHSTLEAVTGVKLPQKV